MGAAENIIIGGLVIGCVGFGIWYYIQTRKNYKASVSLAMKPFTASVDPTTGQATPFNDASGNPQLSCPSGTSINVIGAFFDISDPYGECTTSPGGVIGYLCNPNYKSPQTCSTQNDCPGGQQGIMGCVGGYCQLTPNPSSCPSYISAGGSNLKYASITSGGNSYCVPSDICGAQGPGGYGVPNSVCSPLTNNYQCAMRDATDSVGSKCNGRSECPDLSISDFGPYPCPGLAPPQSPIECISGYDQYGNPEWNATRAGYCALPFIPGWSGGAPNGSTTPNPASASLGYTMHGIYTCV